MNTSDCSEYPTFPHASSIMVSKEDEALITKMRQDYIDSIPLTGPSDEVAEVQNLTIDSENGPAIPVRIYKPLQAEGTLLPILLFIHGGGFVFGNLDTHDVMVRSLCDRAKALVVSVDYRLAPENPFPAGLEDVYTALQWIEKHASSYGADSSRISISGDSAGGNLATATTMLTRDRNGPSIIAQLLFYPTLSNKMDTPSWDRLGEEYFPTRQVNTKIIEFYVPASAGAYDPFVAPLWATSHENLPPTCILVGELDPLLDESKEYSVVLNKAGVKAETRVYPNSVHGFVQYFKSKDLHPQGEKALNDAVDFLTSVFTA